MGYFHSITVVVDKTDYIGSIAGSEFALNGSQRDALLGAFK
jgi:hypothetical protein